MEIRTSRQNISEAFLHILAMRYVKPGGLEAAGLKCRAERSLKEAEKVMQNSAENYIDLIALANGYSAVGNAEASGKIIYNLIVASQHHPWSEMIAQEVKINQDSLPKDPRPEREKLNPRANHRI